MSAVTVTAKEVEEFWTAKKQQAGILPHPTTLHALVFTFWYFGIITKN